MKKLSYFVVVLLLCSGFAAIGFSKDAGDLEKVTMNFLTPVITDENNFVDIEVAGTNTYNFNSGEPKLPVYTETLFLPFGASNFNINCDVQQPETKVLTKKIGPAPRADALGIDDIPIGPIMDEAIYGSSESFPDDWYSYHVGVGLDENMNHKTMLTVRMNPVRYKPALDTIEYVKSIELTINYDDPGSNPFPATSDYELVIITPQKFVDDLQPLVEHKNSYGVSTIVKTTEDIYSEFSGVDKPEKIKYFIKDAIEEWGAKYIILVGGLNNLIYANPMDTENYGDTWWHLPVRWSNVDLHEPGPVSDLYYADVYKEGGVFDDWNGDEDDLIGEWTFKEKQDLYPDIALGRLACRNNNEVRSVVDKIINYENNAYGSDWFEKFITVTGDGFLDQDDLDFEWNTDGLPTGDYTIYAQSNNDEAESGPIEEITVRIDKSAETQLTFNHDDNTRIQNYPQYPALPMAEIVSVSDGDILGNTDFTYDPTEAEAYCNDHTHWGKVEYKNGILSIRGKTYDPKPYGNMTDIHVWIKNSNGDTIFDDWRYNNLMFAEGDWTCGDQMLHGRPGANYYMPSNFDKENLWSSNGNWYSPDEVINAMSQGAGFVFFSGHGSPGSWGNHYPGIPGNRQIADVDGLSVTEMVGVIPTFPMNELSNEYKLPVVVVGGCHNSMFTVSLIPTILNLWIDNNMHSYGRPTPECWSWWPIKLSRSGAIATIGNTGYGYGVLGEWCTVGGVDNWITTEFFAQYGTEGKDILGEAHALAISRYIDEFVTGDKGDVKTVEQWVLLGDPSLKLGGYPPQQALNIAVDGYHGCKPGDTIELEAYPSNGGGSSSYEWSIDKDGDGIFDTYATGKTIEEIWDSPGVYWVKATGDNEITGLTVVEIENEAPNKPSINGPSSVETGKTGTYSFTGSDPNDDELYYLVEWGDGTYDVITPDDSTTVRHKWTNFGTNKVTVKAIDSYGQWSEETLSVSVAKDKHGSHSMPLLQFINNMLEKYPNLFPLLRQIIGLVN